MALTIKTIAKLANVSCTTVSRVLNNKADVKPETRKLILDLIEEHQFQPNVFARGIQSNRSHCVGPDVAQCQEGAFANADVVARNALGEGIGRGGCGRANGSQRQLNLGAELGRCFGNRRHKCGHRSCGCGSCRPMRRPPCASSSTGWMPTVAGSSRSRPSW